MSNSNKRRILRKMFYIAIPLAILLAYIAIQLVLLLGQLTKYQEFWSQNNTKPTADNAITYVALGDSSAQSIGASSPEKGYVGLIAESISTKTNRPVKVINLSKSGAKIENVINSQLPQLKDYNLGPDTIYTIQIGANDAVRNFDIEGFERDMKKLLPLLPKNIIMSDIPSFERTRFSKADKNARAANAILNKLIEPYGYKLAPLYETTKSRASWKNNSIDIFHPNNRGYKNWHDAFWMIIEPKIPI